MDATALNDALADLQHGTSVADRFATLCLVELLREACDTVRAETVLIEWEWSARVSDVTAVCGLPADAAPLLWEWCCDIATDYALESEDPWAHTEV